MQPQPGVLRTVDGGLQVGDDDPAYLPDDGARVVLALERGQLGRRVGVVGLAQRGRGEPHVEDVAVGVERW